MTTLLYRGLPYSTGHLILRVIIDEPATVVRYLQRDPQNVTGKRINLTLFVTPLTWQVEWDPSISELPGAVADGPYPQGDRLVPTVVDNPLNLGMFEKVGIKPKPCRPVV